MYIFTHNKNYQSGDKTVLTISASCKEKIIAFKNFYFNS